MCKYFRIFALKDEHVSKIVYQTTEYFIYHGYLLDSYNDRKTTIKSSFEASYLPMEKKSWKKINLKMSINFHQKASIGEY